MPDVMHGMSDTDGDAARVHLDLLRGASVDRRLALAIGLSATVLDLSRRAFERDGASPEEAALRFVERYYGRELAAGVRARLAERRR
jgi:hypothetical protein